MRMHVFVGEGNQVIATTPVPKADTQGDVVFTKSSPVSSRVKFKVFEVDTRLDLKIDDKDLDNNDLHVKLTEYIKVGKDLRPAQ